MSKCTKCGRELRASESVQCGMGPVCAKAAGIVKTKKPRAAAVKKAKALQMQRWIPEVEEWMRANGIS